MIYDSVLSEYAALGFEYGYSVADRDALVVLGGAVRRLRQRRAGRSSTSSSSPPRTSGASAAASSLLLPHGFEGQGPEHSSARIERFLKLCAEDNLRVVYPTTAAQYFHVLRRQAHRAPSAKPLDRASRRSATCACRRRAHRSTSSPTGGFQLVLDDRAELDRDAVRRVLLCTGKIGHELMDERDERGARRSRSCASSSSTRGRRAELIAAARRATRTPRGVVGAGGAGEHGRLELRPRRLAPRARATGPSSRHVARARERQPRERQLRRSTTASSSSSSPPPSTGLLTEPASYSRSSCED